MVHSHWRSLGQGPGPRRMGCMVLRRTFNTAPEQEQGEWVIPIFQVLKLFQGVYFNDISVVFRCPVLAPETASVNGFCIILVPVPVPVLETSSVNTPLERKRTTNSLCSNDTQHIITLSRLLFPWSFPVVCVIFPDFSLSGKCLPIFPGFTVRAWPFVVHNSKL